MAERNSCPLCEKELIETRPIQTGYLYKCSQCGGFIIPDMDMPDGTFLKENIHLIAGFLFEIKNKESECDPLILDNHRINVMLKSPFIPKKISEKPIKFLKFLNSQTEEYGKEIPIPPAAMYAKTIDEAHMIANELDDDEKIKLEGTLREEIIASITLKGMQHIEEYERKNVTKPDQAFVAMWFSKKDSITDNVWGNIIKPGCLEAGYNPVKVNDQHFNDNVIDEIIALIKESAFAVVDYSGYRGGVYYEAGYAKGLGKEVISLCHESWFNGDETEYRKVHFDVNHNNFIVWETGKQEEARIQLTNRIRATVGKGNYKTE